MRSARKSHAIPYSHFEQLREARQIIGHESEALSTLSRRLDSAFCAAVNVICEASGDVVVTGVGKAGLIGGKIAATMLSTGTRARFLHPVDAVHGDLGCLGEGDVLLALSNSGETEELCQLLPYAKRFSAPIIAVTGTETSTLGQAADIVVQLGRLQEAGRNGLAPTTSTTAMLALGDALALIVSQTRGFTAQQFAVYHPGGSLGRKLTLVREIMRREDELRIASQDASVRDVFAGLSQPERRTGAVMLVDAQSKLAGLFTDSDLARLLEQRRDEQLDRPISESMTAHPVTIGPEETLSDAVDLLSDRRVSELPVVDAEGRPVGLIDITDVLALMPTEAAE